MTTTEAAHVGPEPFPSGLLLRYEIIKQEQLTAAIPVEIYLTSTMQARKVDNQIDFQGVMSTVGVDEVRVSAKDLNPKSNE